MKRILDTNIKEIRIFSRDEKKQDDMRNLYKNDKIKGVISSYLGIYRSVTHKLLAEGMSDVFLF